MTATTEDIVIKRGAAAAWCRRCTKRYRHDCTTKIMEAIGELAERERISYDEAADIVNDWRSGKKRWQRDDETRYNFACEMGE